MTSNFHIISYNFEDSLYLRLIGDFDGGSAHELINTLTKNGNGSWDIFIDTNGLKTIHSFDRNIFQKNLDNIKKQVKDLIIVGANKYKLTQD